MPKRRPRFDPDERVSLHPLTGEEVLERLLGAEPDEDEPEAPEAEET